MSIGISIAPAAVMRRAFFVVLLGLSLGPAHAQSTKQYRPSPEYVQLGKPDQEEGKRVLSDFRQLGIIGDYYFEFSLKMTPRRGEEKVAQGRMWGGKREGVSVIRLIVPDDKGGEFRYLIFGGSDASAWKWHTGDLAAVRLSTGELFSPIGATLLTPFDLQMPYLFWKDFAYEGLAKIRERPTHKFLIYPPAAFTLGNPSLTGVRIGLDSQYGALVESELLGNKDGEVQKTMSLVELKKLSEQYILKTIDIRDEVSRAKTRLSIRAASLGQNFSSALFISESLPEQFDAPAEATLTRF